MDFVRGTKARWALERVGAIGPCPRTVMSDWPRAMTWVQNGSIDADEESIDYLCGGQCGDKANQSDRA